MLTELNELIEQKTLSICAAKTTLKSIASGECSDAVVAALLTAFRMRSLTIAELTGFREALLELCLKVDLTEFDTIDLCGSGGDYKNTFNISTTAAFIVAGAGIKVAKHGNFGASSKSGSSNVIEALGAPFSNSADKLKLLLEKANICYLHAPLFHPAMKNIAQVRRELGIRTFLNILGPLVNPSAPRRQLIGAATAELSRLYGYFLQGAPIDFCVVHSLHGYDEFSLTGNARLLSNSGEQLLTSRDFGLNAVSPAALTGGSTAEDNARLMISVLSGTSSSAMRDVAISNAALAIRLVRPTDTLLQAVDQARYSIDSGQALQKLKTFVELSSI